MTFTIMAHAQDGTTARVAILPENPRADGTPLTYLTLADQDETSTLTVFLDRDMVRRMRVVLEEAEQRLDDLGVVLPEPVL